MSVPVTTGNFADLLWPGLADLFGDKYNDYPKVWPKVFETKQSSKSYEKEQGVTGTGLAAIKEQGAPVQFTGPTQGFAKEYVNVTYGLGAVVTREMWEDDQYNYINTIPSMLARSMVQTEETVNANHFNNGFTAGFTGADGVSLFNASHVLAGTGGTYRNQPSTAADLTQTSLEQAFIDIGDWRDDMNLKIMVKPKLLLVPNDLQFTAQKILQTEKVVDSADNTMNPMRGKLPFEVWLFLIDPDAWFIITDCMNGMTHFQRRAVQPERDNEFSTQNLQFLTTERFSSGWTDPRGAYGSSGS